MRNLRFNIEKQKMEKSGDFSNIVSGSSEYLQCNFSFCKEWDGLFKIAEFRNSENGECYPEQIVGNRCMVPKEVTGGRQWYVNAIGKKGKKELITNRIRIRQEV